jgi:RimJ/RimL family protein N-acetyltransferase
MIILLEYAFKTLMLDEIRLEVLEFNLPAIRVYQKLGFVRTHRSGWHYDAEGGQYWQVWSMCLTSDRFSALQKRLTLGAEIKMIPFTKI